MGKRPASGTDLQSCMPMNDLGDERDGDVVVIGAGLTGLTLGEALGRAGLRFHILESESKLGESWRRRHAQLSLNTHRDLSHFPGLPYPPGTPAFPPKAALIHHLEDFRARHRLPTEFGTTVKKIALDGNRWILHTSAGERRARDVVVTTGRDRVPYIPQWPGMREFTGQILHSADFGVACDYEGKRVLVVGAGNSAFDILNHLAATGTASAIWLSARNGPSILPKRIGKIAVHPFSPITNSLPRRLGDLVIATAQRAIFGDLTRYGLPPAPRGAVSRLASDHVAIASDDGAVAAIKSGVVRPVAALHSFEGAAAVLSNGNAVFPDIVIAATGYRTGLEPMVGMLDVLDQQGTPRFNGSESDPRWPGLWFAGMRPSILGYFKDTAREANAIARAIVRSR